MPAIATTQAQPLDEASLNKSLLLTFVALAIFTVLASPLYASGASVGNALCQIVYVIQGDLGRGVATLAIISIGLGACFGKASWGMAILVAVGIAVVFGASSLVNALNLGGSGC